ncbi:MAG: hypothetical protein GW748_06185 [Alphaproteobacteria bacterium]|nr:hypothetical protein [Alphaproteobacteria bacterium]NCQ67315.1 hypothetical protein [Alphaproteobacteria bacterium]NCT06718.1 hypothetical protein [Alphaproteobacteria bacterium]
MINKYIVFLFASLVFFSNDSKSCLRHPSYYGVQELTQAEINAGVIETATRVYSDINTHHIYPTHEETIISLHKSWEAKYITSVGIDGTGKKVTMNVPTLTHTGSLNQFGDDLEELVKTDGCVLECTIALQITQILCLRDLLGGDNFNAYVALMLDRLQEEKLSIDDLFGSLCPPFFNTFEGAKEIPGSITYLTNVVLYKNFKPSGNGRGSNVFCVGDNAYLGFSGIYAKGPQDLRTIEDQDLELFTRTCDLQENEEMHKIFSQHYSSHPEEFYVDRARDQCLIQFYQIFDEELINDFRKWQHIDINF